MAFLAIHTQKEKVSLACDQNGSTRELEILTQGMEAHELTQEIMVWFKRLAREYQSIEFIVTNSYQSVPGVSGIFLAATDPFDCYVAKEIGKQLKKSVYIIDPPSQLEYHGPALVTGSRAIWRACNIDTFIFKYLYAAHTSKYGLEFAGSNLIMVSLADEIQLVALKDGQVIDSCHSLNEGPFGWQNSGGLPFDQVLEHCEKVNDATKVLSFLQSEGGVKSYLDLHSMEQLFAKNSPEISLIREALVYQISKEIGALATVLKGQQQAIIFTGELAKCTQFVEELLAKTQFLAESFNYPGNRGLDALRAGAARIVRKETILTY